MSSLQNEIDNRRTFAIISHPDAGKTTMTEKLLLHGKAIQMAGTVKARKSSRHATSDWMQMEQQRGISITTSVMQFPYKNRIVNLLDTPGHADFSEDTYRTLTAVDSVLMVIDGVKGVEERTIKLMDVCRMRATPIFTFINKMDRDIRDPLELLDEIEEVLNIQCAPITWPIGMGKFFKGIYHLPSDEIHLYQHGFGHTLSEQKIIVGKDSPAAREHLGDLLDELNEQIELIAGASHGFDSALYLAGKQTPVFFGTALGNFGIYEMLDLFVEQAPKPFARESTSRLIPPNEDSFSGFVFKIQANMDPNHRDRIAFLRICSGHYEKNMKMRHVRLNKDVKIADAVTFLAGDRTHADIAWPGDIIGLHNHGTIQIGDTFTAGEELKYLGIPNFAPELFRRVRLKDPLKNKQLQKGLKQLSEEGAVQVFLMERSNDIVVGAVGVLQFDVVAFRLKDEYRVECVYDSINIFSARWIDCPDIKKVAEFERKCHENLARDGGGHLTYLAPNRANLSLTEERWPEIEFKATREH